MTDEMIYHVVIDTNVLISALRSKRGASYKLISLVGTGKFKICLSVSVVVEYEAVAKRLVGTEILYSFQNIDNIIDYLCSVAELYEIHFLIRPHLNDPDDEKILELAANANSSHIVTYNKRDFRGADDYGIEILSPHEFLQKIGELP